MIWIFLKRFSLNNNNILGAQFLLLIFLDNFNFLIHFFWMMPNFGDSTLCLLTKYNIFLKVSWFLAKNLLNFVSLPWKLENPYCHTVQGRRNWGCQGWARGPFASHPIFGRYKSFISPSSELLLLLGTTGPLEFLNHPPVLRFACWLCLPDFLNTPFCLHF